MAVIDLLQWWRWDSGLMPVRGRRQPTPLTASNRKNAFVPIVLDGLYMRLHEKAFAARAGVDVVVSDSQARILYLPWQNKLHSEAQREVYAHGCFEQAGQPLDGDWLVPEPLSRCICLDMPYKQDHRNQ
ncbi:hypothetical protein [Massilia phyllosphaerae]|uniref:hypothetical protein n=1 Tax=Massilia phyllosphaerae TaxID=3106034 RepID=UPI002B1CCA4E|nr:hypothetical protein [Massilia sp. SGZ-792]